MRTHKNTTDPKSTERQPWEPAGVISHSPERDHAKKTEIKDKGGIHNLEVENTYHDQGFMEKP